MTDQLLHADARYEMKNLSVICGTFATPTATVEMLIDGEERKAAQMGDGPVDAAFRAITELTSNKARLVRYHVNAITSGMDAQGEVAVTLEEEGLRVLGQGADTDIVVASAKAYVHAINKLAKLKERGSGPTARGI